MQNAFVGIPVAAVMLACTTAVPAAQLSTDARAAIPPSGDLEIQFAASDEEFASLLESPLFQNVLA